MLDEPIDVDGFLENTEYCESRNTLWGSNATGPERSRCIVTPALCIDVVTPGHSGRGRLLPGEVEVNIDGGHYGPALPNAEIRNEVTYNHALRYLCKLLEGRIEEKELRSALEEASTGHRVIRNCGGRDYIFRRYINDVSITFKW